MYLIFNKYLILRKKIIFGIKVNKLNIFKFFIEKTIYKDLFIMLIYNN